MSKVVVTGGGSSRDFAVSDPAEAVREVSKMLRKYGTDQSVLRTLQMWADHGFKKAVRVTIKEETFVIEYRQ